jgi:hypothetical protein
MNAQGAGHFTQAVSLCGEEAAESSAVAELFLKDYRVPRSHRLRSRRFGNCFPSMIDP